MRRMQLLIDRLPPAASDAWREIRGIFRGKTSTAECRSRSERYGTNELAPHPGPTPRPGEDENSLNAFR